MLSIITVTYNSEKTLENTIKSVLQQNTDKIREYVIIDGKSKDDTIKIAEKYRIEFFNRKIEYKVISEEDSGIYDAMNKGINLSKGKYLFFLNSGDSLIAEDVIEKIFYGENGDIIYGDIVVKGAKNETRKNYPEKISKHFFFVDTLCHQAVFIKKKVFNEVGQYNIGEKIFADFEHLLKAYVTKKYSWIHKNIVVVKYDLSGISSKKSFIYKFIYRTKIIWKNLKFYFFIEYIIYWFLFKPIYAVKNRIR